ncbi:MAG: S41 family peptidase [Ginsengibacter sp.]
MKKFLLATGLLASISLSGIGQPLDTSARVKIFIKVWGFLKYYHPLVATGTIDWDSVFTKNIQKIIIAKNSTEFNNAISGVINSAGKAPKLKQQTVPGDLFLKNKTNINWIVNSKVFNKEIKAQLQFIYANQNQDSNRYIKMLYNTTDFSGEKTYYSLGFPDKKYRFLFLSRFWNIINYFAPYKYLTTNWDDVLEKFIPKVFDARDTLSYFKTLQELCKSLNDGHSQLTLSGQTSATDIFFGKYTVPFYCEIINKKVVIRKVTNDSIAKELNIQQGDVVLKMDGKDLKDIINDRRNFISASNYADEMHQLSRYILDGQTPTAVLELERENKAIKTTVTRISTATRDWGAFINYTYNDVGYKKLSDSILLIYAMQIWDGNIDTIKHLIKQSKAIIFDVRNYPQNDVFYSITDPFLSEPKTINYSTVALPNFPGFFKWELNPNKVGHISDSAFKGKVIILCDERTQSQGEYSCMVLQTIPKAITIGSQTAGTDGVRKEIPMGGGLTMSYSTYGIYYPDKTQTQRTGIKIDLQVSKTVIALKNNEDEILERALQYIKNGD